MPVSGGERGEGVRAPAGDEAERGGRRFGLQTRTIFAFAVGAALLSAALAFGTFVVVRQDLLAQRVNSALREAYGNAHLVNVELRSPSADVAKALDSVASTTEAHSFINRHGLWFSGSASARGTVVPHGIAQVVLSGHVAEQRVSLDGTPYIVVGIPLPSVGVSYFEERPLTELQSTLSVLGTVLFVAAVATTVGGAVAGWWASRRLIRPLSDVALIASEIAGGTLDRRVPADPDLQPLVSSFNDMVTALQDRIERDARFASDVTHELRSPLTTIGASVELLGSYRDRLPEGGAQALKYPHVLLGVLAIFMYVGGEVSMGSSIINFLGQRTIAGLTPVEASKFVSLFWGGMLIGRFMGATELSGMKRKNKQCSPEADRYRCSPAPEAARQRCSRRASTTSFGRECRRSPFSP